MRLDNMLRARRAAALALIAAVAPRSAQAGYPAKPVRIVVPSSAGGGTDITRASSRRSSSERLGQQVVIDNRPGAGTMIGMELAAKSPPDGYTLLVAPSTLAINSAMYKKVPYDPVRDFAPITQSSSAAQHARRASRRFRRKR